MSRRRRLEAFLAPVLMVGLLLLSGCHPSESPRREFRIVGYATAWSGRTREIPFEYLTHVHYAFLLPHPRGDGSLLPVQNPDKANGISRLPVFFAI